MHQRRFHFTRATLAPPHPAPPEPRIVEVTCAYCWGQGRIFVAHPGGAMSPMRCPSCLGVRSRFELLGG